MVKYAISKHNVDASRVFVTGHSSGGMMTQTMIGAYPELFKAGASSAGVPFSCMRGTGYWSDDCAKGRIVRTGAEWASAVKAAYPGYTGPRPKVALYHGTNDDILYFANQAESVKQWTNIHGISETPVKTQSNNPRTNWTKYTYGNGEVVAITGQDQPHNLEVVADDVVAWFGLNSVPTTSTTTTSTTTNTTPTTTTTLTTSTTTSTQPTATGVKNKWEQCGG
jgi:acetylxylan esterase